MRGGYTHIPFINVLDAQDVEAFFGSSPCAAVNMKEVHEREAACNSVTDAGPWGCLYDAKVHRCEPLKNAYRQVLSERAVAQQDVPSSSGAHEFNVPDELVELERLSAAYMNSGGAHTRAVQLLSLFLELVLVNPVEALEVANELQRVAIETRHAKLIQIVRLIRRLYI